MRGKPFFNSFGSWFSAIILLTVFVLAIGAYVFSPEKLKDANRMNLSIANKPMGFEATYLIIPTDDTSDEFWSFLTGYSKGERKILIEQYSLNKNQLQYLEYNKPDKKEFWKTISTTQWKEFSTDKYIQSFTFWLGTDKYGRDFLSRMIIGSRVSISVGIIAVLISFIIGMLIGSLAGYYGGVIDSILMWLINITWSVPTLLLVIAINLALGKGFYQVFVAIGLTMWVEIARVVRGQILSEKEKEYIQAAKVIGQKNSTIIIKHILPNIITPVILLCTANFAAAILIESGLSFLGIGTQPPTPSWGNLIKEHYNYLLLGKPHLAIVPGVAICLTVMAFLQLGNSLREYLSIK